MFGCPIACSSIPTGVYGWGKAFARSPPAARTPSGSSRSPARSASAGGGFYWHFDDRGALLEEMLDTWERASIDEVIERVEREGGHARARLRRAGALTFSDWLLPIDLAVRDWARRDERVAERLRRVDNRRMDYLRSLFGAFCPDEDDVEARCMLAFSLMIGNHFIASDHGARSRADVLELVMRRLEA